MNLPTINMSTYMLIHSIYRFSTAKYLSVKKTHFNDKNPRLRLLSADIYEILMRSKLSNILVS